MVLLSIPINFLPWWASFSDIWNRTKNPTNSGPISTKETYKMCLIYCNKMPKISMKMLHLTYQSMSIHVNSCQFMSIYVNSCQIMSTLVSKLSNYVNLSQIMSIYVNLCHFMSIYVNLCQFMSIYVNQSMSILCQYTYVNLCHFMSI
jgi:hypothetical protein